MPNPVYTYILEIYHLSTKLNGSVYCYVELTIQLNISHLFTQLNDQTVLFQTIHFSISHLFALIEKTLSGAPTLGQRAPRSNEGVLHIPQALSLYCLG